MREGQGRREQEKEEEDEKEIGNERGRGTRSLSVTRKITKAISRKEA